MKLGLAKDFSLSADDRRVKTQGIRIVVIGESGSGKERAENRCWSIGSSIKDLGNKDTDKRDKRSY